MVISTSSAGSSGGTFLSGREDETILFLAVGNVSECCKPHPGISELAPCSSALVAQPEAPLSLSVSNQEHSEHGLWL